MPSSSDLACEYCFISDALILTPQSALSSSPQRRRTLAFRYFNTSHLPHNLLAVPLPRRFLSHHGCQSSSDAFFLPLLPHGTTGGALMHHSRSLIRHWRAHSPCESRRREDYLPLATHDKASSRYWTLVELQNLSIRGRYQYYTTTLTSPSC